MKTQLLRDKDVFPSPDVLRDVLGKRYAVLNELLDMITGEDYGLDFEWRYYNDGKSWLGKAVYKKKTIFWLSVWDGYFQTGFYFTEKTRNGVMDLNIDDGVKSAFAQAEVTGKLVPLSLKIDKKQQLKDVLEIVKYKKTRKKNEPGRPDSPQAARTLDRRGKDSVERSRFQSANARKPSFAGS